LKKIKNRIIRYIYESWWIFLLVGLCFIIGLFFGFLGVNSLNAEQISLLESIFSDSLTHFEENLNLISTTRQTTIKSLSNLGKIFVFGLTVIGMPIILAMIFTRGFVLGFTIGFLIKEKLWQGFLISLLVIVPPNILSIISYIFGAVVAINFSLFLIKGQSQRKIKTSQYFLEYIFIMLGLSILLLSSALIEGYLSPLFLKLFF